MSAIDNAFIRAYTLDTAVASVPAQNDFDEPSTFTSASGVTDMAPDGSAAAVVAGSQRVVAKPSTSAERPSRRAIGTANPIAVAQAASRRPANSAVSPGKSSSATADKAPMLAPAPIVAHPVVPAPHIRLAAFVHTATTIEQSSTAQNTAILEPPIADEPAMDSESANAEMLAEEFPVVASPDVESSQAPAAPPEIIPATSPLPITGILPDAVQATVPSTLPFSAEVAAKLEEEANAPCAAFEVDHFAWPDLCNALLEKRAGEFDQLVGKLVTESALGRKVVAITGSRRGDGRTTLAMLLARRLAETAVKVVVVDADFEVPQLAARLGMAVESGWENALTDNLPVWDALVESLADRVAMLPLAPRAASTFGQQTATEFVALHAETIRKHLETLRKHFDVVLVDAGVVKAARPDAKPRGLLALAESVDAAIIVSDSRMTAPARIAELHRRLQEANIVPLGIAENFCPSKSD